MALLTLILQIVVKLVPLFVALVGRAKQVSQSLQSKTKPTSQKHAIAVEKSKNQIYRAVKAKWVKKAGGCDLRFQGRVAENTDRVNGAPDPSNDSLRHSDCFRRD